MGGAKIIRVILTYLVCYVLTLPFQLYYFPNVDLGMQWVKNVFTLSYYEIGIWYVRVQVLLYFLFLICFILIRQKYSAVFLCICSIITCLILKVIGLESFWYNTLLCFSLGIFIAEKKENIRNLLSCNGKMYLRLLVLSFLVFVCCFSLKKYSVFDIIYPLAFCCFVTFFLFKFRLRSKVFSWLGSLSLELYLVHIIFVKYFIIDGFWNISLGFKYILIVLFSVVLSYLIHHVLVRRILAVIL